MKKNPEKPAKRENPEKSVKKTPQKTAKKSPQKTAKKTSEKPVKKAPKKPIKKSSNKPTVKKGTAMPKSRSKKEEEYLTPTEEALGWNLEQKKRIKKAMAKLPPMPKNWDQKNVKQSFDYKKAMRNEFKIYGTIVVVIVGFIVFCNISYRIDMATKVPEPVKPYPKLEPFQPFPPLPEDWKSRQPKSKPSESSEENDEIDYYDIDMDAYDLLEYLDDTDLDYQETY